MYKTLFLAIFNQTLIFFLIDNFRKYLFIYVICFNLLQMINDVIECSYNCIYISIFNLNRVLVLNLLIFYA